jgi:hypothetical protein
MRKTIKFFIASSAELKRERMELVDMIQDMNDELETKNIKIKPVLWEYMDSSMRAERKEDVYLAKLRDCEICIVLFWQILGEYTVEELDVAVKEMRSGRCPKEVHVLFKAPAPNASDELISFKENFYNKYQLNPETFNDISSLRKQVEDILHSFISK